MWSEGSKVVTGGERNGKTGRVEWVEESEKKE